MLHDFFTDVQIAVRFITDKAANTKWSLWVQPLKRWKWVSRNLTGYIDTILDDNAFVGN